MPKSYSGDLRERVIEAVEIEGASRREAAERFDISASSAVKWLQRWNESRSAVPKPRGGSISPLEAHAERILALVAERPDLTLKEALVELLKRRIRTSKSALSRFFDRHGITVKKKACKPRNDSERTWLVCADVGYESKACLIPPGWCLSMRLRSAPIWCD
jgi:transposase